MEKAHFIINSLYYLIARTNYSWFQLKFLITNANSTIYHISDSKKCHPRGSIRKRNDFEVSWHFNSLFFFSISSIHLTLFLTGNKYGELSQTLAGSSLVCGYSPLLWPHPPPHPSKYTVPCKLEKSRFQLWLCLNPPPPVSYGRCCTMAKPHSDHTVMNKSLLFVIVHIQVISSDHNDSFRVHWLDIQLWMAKILILWIAVLSK